MYVVVWPEHKNLDGKGRSTSFSKPLHLPENMSISESELPPFLKRNASLEEAEARDFEWFLLEILASRNDGILGLRLIECAGGKDILQLLIAPDCRRKVLAGNLQLPEIMNGPRSKAKVEPGHFIPITADRLERTEWWHEEMAPRIRAEYFKKRNERSDGPMTRAVTAAELAEIAAIKGHTPDSGVEGQNERTTVGQALGNREIKEAVMDWLKERSFDEITHAMVGIGKVGKDSHKLVEITLPTKDPASPLVRRLKKELERAGINAEPIYLSNSLAFRFASTFVNSIDR